VGQVTGLGENCENRLSEGNFAEQAQSLSDRVCRLPMERWMPRRAGRQAAMPQHPAGQPA